MIDGEAFADYIAELVQRGARARIEAPILPRLVCELALRLDPRGAAEAVARVECAAGLIREDDRQTHVEDLRRIFWTTRINGSVQP